MNKTQENNNKIAVVYCRVSTDEQAKEGLSIQEQERLCIEKAKRDGFSILSVIKDEGKSGGSLDRPGMKELIRLSISKQINAVFTVHSDRIARNTENYLYLRELFRSNHIQLFFIQLPNLDESASSKMMDTMLASINQYHRDITSEKVIMTMEGKAKLGYFPGLAPLGYVNITRKDPSIERAGQKIVVKDPNKAPLVKEVFELYATGNYNVFDLTDISYERGLRTRNNKKISHSRMYDVLRNSFYVGEVHWGSVHLKDGKHEHLIDRYLFNKVQELLNIKSGNVCRRRKYQWLLSGFIKCHTHKCRYTAEWHLDKKLAYYHCTNKTGCGKYTEKNKLEDLIADKFKELEFSEKFIKMVIEKIQTIFYERRKLFNDKKKDLINKKTPLELKMKRAEEKLLDNIIRNEDFLRIREEITQELLDIDNKITELEKQKNVNMDVTQQVLNLTKDIYHTYDKAPEQLKRHLLGFFWESFEIKDGVIIKSVPSVIFDKLLRLQEAFYRTPKQEKPYEITGFSEVIKSHVLSSR